MNEFTLPPQPLAEVEKVLMLDMDAISALKEKVAALPGYMRFSNEQIDMIYCVAHSIFMQGKLESACSIFQTLLIYRPLDSRILTAYGLCCKQLGMFEQAIPALTCAYLLDSEDVKHAVHIAECLAALGKYEESSQILDPLLQLTEVDASLANIQKRAGALKHMLSERSA
jgi:tetratricopeptide (TPR) repeat protein